MHTKLEFQLDVIERAPEEISRDTLWRGAGDHWDTREGRVYPADVATVIQQAAEGPTRPVEKLKTSWLPATPESRITADLLLRRCRPLVTATRREIFGSPERPFPSLEEAVEWLEASQGAQNDEPPIPFRQLRRLGKRLARRFMVLRLESFTVDYLRPRERWVHRVAVTNEDLARLRSCSERIAQATGFHPAAVTCYVLAGIRPRLARVRLGRPNLIGWDSDLGRALPRFSMTFHTRDVTLEELTTLYREYRTGLPEKLKPLTPSDEKLFQAIRRVDAETEPRKRKGKTYYERIKRLWKPNTTWQTVKTQKWRLSEKLKVRGIPLDGLED